MHFGGQTYIEFASPQQMEAYRFPNPYESYRLAFNASGENLTCLKSGLLARSHTSKERVLVLTNGWCGFYAKTGGSGSSPRLLLLFLGWQL